MIGVIADDLTGAAEIGAIGWRNGWRAEIVRGGATATGADLVCVDTDSRSCPPALAAERAAAAAAMLRDAGARWIYKKVDSVLRGNVTAEVEAVMKTLGLNRALLLPVNPTLGRTIAGGKLFIYGRPIHETEFARDPEHPRASPEVMDLLERPSTLDLRISGGIAAVPENTLLIAQAETSAQVAAWAAACDESCLPVGGAEFFKALLEPGPGVPELSPDFRAGRQLFVCGTASKSVDAVVAASRATGVPVFGLPPELAGGAEFSEAMGETIARQIADAFEASRRVVLRVGLPAVADVVLAKRLSGHLTDIAARVLESAPVASVFAEGGATAAELVRRMDWRRLEVKREWATGVATLELGGEKSTRWLTIKPGSYAWPEEWVGMK